LDAWTLGHTACAQYLASRPATLSVLAFSHDSQAHLDERIVHDGSIEDRRLGPRSSVLDTGLLTIAANEDDPLFLQIASGWAHLAASLIGRTVDISSWTVYHLCSHAFPLSRLSACRPRLVHFSVLSTFRRAGRQCTACSFAPRLAICRLYSSGIPHYHCTRVYFTHTLTTRRHKLAQVSKLSRWQDCQQAACRGLSLPYPSLL